MNKKLVFIITAALLIIGLAVAGYFYWPKTKAKPEQGTLEKAGEAAEKITESATQGALPSLDIQTNPLEKAPDINPVGQSNPFKDIKTNPFR